uniref:Uncharacterized protein n=1 Tax=Oryza meridionalis TaxID=40149 RepID=A0A0E0D8E6_9ORYZ
MLSLVGRAVRLSFAVARIFSKAAAFFFYAITGITVGERKFPKEVVVAYVDYCKRASVCEENQRVCHMYVFIEQRCQNYIVKQSKKPSKLYATNYFGSSIITLAFDIVHLLPILDEATG